MLTAEMIETLRAYNAWRRQGDCEPEDRLPMPDPKAIGVAIDEVLAAVEELRAMRDARIAELEAQVKDAHEEGWLNRDSRSNVRVEYSSKDWLASLACKALNRNHP